MILKRNLVFVRHAQSIGNTTDQDGRALMEVPNHEYELTELGMKQSIITGEYLRRNYGAAGFSSFFHSTFKRTSETLRIILQCLEAEDAQPICDSRLDEKWDGIFHELSRAEIELRYPDQLRLRKRSGYYHFRAPGGENCPDVEMRIRSFLTEHFSSPDNGNGLIVGHGRWFLILQKLLHRLNVEQFLTLKKRDDCKNCSITVYQIETDLSVVPSPITPWEGQIEEVASECA
jgi:broad specificity phosphatase PhoE